MNTKHVSYLMSASLGLLILGLVGTAYIANGLLEKQAKTLYDLKLKKQVMDEEQKSLITAKKNVEKYNTLDKIARTIVPQDKDQAQAVREIVKLASESKIPLSSITFPTSSLGASTPTAASGGKNLTQLTPVVGVAGLYVMPITVTQAAGEAVSYNQFIEFLKRLEQNRRTAQISNIVLNPNPQNPSGVTFTLIVDRYIKP